MQTACIIGLYKSDYLKYFQTVFHAIQIEARKEPALRQRLFSCLANIDTLTGSQAHSQRVDK